MKICFDHNKILNKMWTEKVISTTLFIAATLSVVIEFTNKCTVETQFHKPLYNEVLRIMNNILHPSNSKRMENNPDITNHQ